MRLRHRPSRPLAAPARERGAIIVEMAIVALFLVTLLAAGFDLGMAWRGGLAVTEGARAGVRVGSAVGVDVNADREMLLSVRAALDSSDMLSSVDRVVVYSAGVDGRVPAACKTATRQTSGCTILTGAQLTSLTAGSAIEANGCIKNILSQGFCPTNRKDVPAEADSIGIWITAEHDNIFPISGESQTISRSAVMRIEPRSVVDEED